MDTIAITMLEIFNNKHLIYEMRQQTAGQFVKTDFHILQTLDLIYLVVTKIAHNENIEHFNFNMMNVHFLHRLLSANFTETPPSRDIFSI